MTIAISLLDAQQTRPFSRQLGQVYQAAFAAPPYQRDASAARFFEVDTFPRHLPREGFRCCIAQTQNDGAIIGFSYGYTGARGQWWTDAVASEMSRDLANYWLPKHFELVELALLPAFHGQGIGGQLHDTLLASLPHERAMLSTSQTWTPARALYDKRGWQEILSHFCFPGSTRPYVIMGKELALQKAKC